MYWPAFLMAAGMEPPKRIVCHSHWTVNDEKVRSFLLNLSDIELDKVSKDADNANDVGGKADWYLCSDLLRDKSHV